MWFITLAFGLLLILASVIYAISIKFSNLSRYRINNYIACIIILVIGVAISLLSGGSGVRNYAQIPRIHQDIRLEKINENHYHEAMKYNLGDESNERRSASHVYRFRNGDFSEAKDNKTWKQNYSDWYYNKGLITYHKMQLKYYQHPIKNWRDGAGMNSLYDSINK